MINNENRNENLNENITEPVVEPVDENIAEVVDENVDKNTADPVDKTIVEPAVNEKKDSIYSYNYTDKSQHTATHDGDYYASRSSQQQGGNQNNQWQSGSQSTQWQSGNQSRSYYNPQDGSVYRAPKQETDKPAKKAEKKHGGFVKALGKCVILAVIFGLVAGGVFQGVAHIGNNTASEQTSADAANTGTISNNTVVDATSVSTAVTVTDVSDIVENVMPAIVSITNMSTIEYYTYFGQTLSYEGESAGSGIIVAEDDTNLYIVTNNHVVADATSLTVSFVDDQAASATIKGTDASSDLAVIYVAKSDLSAETLASIKVATLGDSDELKVGESAIAIGNALGYGQSVTTGVISALNREVTTSDSSTGTSVTNELIQTDAAINPGNSGGALLNMNGEVIGINSVKYSDTSVEGMGYAIPINTASPIINELITREKVDEAKTAYLGISGVDVTSELSQTYNMPEGIYVVQVAEGSAAEKAGLVRGDIITAFDGKTVTSMEELQELLQYYEAGKTVEMKIQYADRGTYIEETVTVTLGSKVN